MVIVMDDELADKTQGGKEISSVVEPIGVGGGRGFCPVAATVGG